MSWKLQDLTTRAHTYTERERERERGCRWKEGEIGKRGIGNRGVLGSRA